MIPITIHGVEYYAKSDSDIGREVGSKRDSLHVYLVKYNTLTVRNIISFTLAGGWNEHMAKVYRGDDAYIVATTELAKAATTMYPLHDLRYV